MRLRYYPFLIAWLMVFCLVEYGELLAQTFTIDSLEADGTWCPMAHCNRHDDSFQSLPPLLSVSTVQKITDPAVSSRAFIYLGCVTGEVAAVCAYDSPSKPALVAYNYQDGSVKWTSQLTDLPGTDRRRPAGILLAKIGINGTPVRHWTFAANPVEFVAYGADGTRLWKRSTNKIAPAASEGIGAPVSLSFSDARELVTATTKGWIVKLNPVNGSTIDVYKMDTNVVVNGTIYKGTFTTSNSPIVIGNVLYLVTAFKADPSNPLDPGLSPVHVVRIELVQPGIPGFESKIKPLIRPLNPSDFTPDRAFIGVNKAGGSPLSWIAPAGKVLIFADADDFITGQLQPVIAAVEDSQGTLGVRWRSLLNLIPGDDINAAPAFHAGTQTLVVNTRYSVYVFRNIDILAGDIPPPPSLAFEQLVTCGMDSATATAKVGSPIGLTYNPETNELVAYTNFRIVPSPGSPTYGYLGAFSLSTEGPIIGRPLWCQPLAVTATGAPAPGSGTFGQPALFRYHSESGQATGLIVNTVSTDTYIFK